MHRVAKMEDGSKREPDRNETRTHIHTRKRLVIEYRSYRRGDLHDAFTTPSS